MSDMLPDRQVFQVKRIEDEALIGVCYTMKKAKDLAEEYYNAWQEECRIGRAFVPGGETVEQRNKNEEE